MPRTTDAAVRKVINVETDVDITPYIETAAHMVDEVCAPHYVGDDVKLELIERWLSAHYVCVNNPQAMSEQASAGGGGVQQTMEPVRVDLGLRSTKYGQQALRIDTGGYLAALDNAMDDVKKRLPGANPRYSVTWLGTDPCAS